MGGVGDEAPLAVGGRLESVEHAVQGAGEAADLVVAAGFGDAPVQIAAGDLGGLCADAFDRAQGAADQQPGDADGRQKDHRQKVEKVPLEVVVQVCEQLGGAADVDDDGFATGDVALRDDPFVPAAG